MIENTTDISSEMNIMEAELKENERELLQIRVNEASKCSKMKFSIFKVLFAKTEAS